MLKTYSLIRKGDCFLLRRLIYPRCKLLVDIGKPIPEIKKIKFLDRCSATDMAKIINEIGAFLESFNVEC